jgi:hypothetical protein
MKAVLYAGIITVALGAFLALVFAGVFVQE